MNKLIYKSLTLLALTLTGCLTEASTEVTQNTDVKNLRVSFNGLSIDSVIKPSDQLDKSIPGVYLSIKLNVENSGTSTVKTQGLVSQISFNKINESPLELKFRPFSIEAKNRRVEEASSILNFESQKQTINYIITQALEDAPLESEVQINILYDLVNQQGELDLPQINQDIPTDQIPSDVITQMQEVIEP